MLFCDECNQERRSREEVRKGTYTIHGKEIEVAIKVAACEVCGTEMYDESLVNASMKKINDTYVTLFGMPAEEIRAVRSEYKGLGLRPFAKILGIGSASISRHEAGSLPSDNHLSIYRELQADPRRILAYFEHNKYTLTPREQKKAAQVLVNWQDERAGTADQHTEFMQDDEEIIEAIHKPFEYTELSGYLPFSLEKFVNMVLYFTQNGVNKTKMMKLLWYADFLHFKRQTVSISGAVYTRLKFGPVPKDHEITLAHLQHMEAIEVEETLLNDEGWTKMTVKATQAFDPSLFKPHELATMEEIQHVFRDYGSRKISLYSHEESAWKETPEEQPIDYRYASALRDFEMT